MVPSGASAACRMLTCEPRPGRRVRELTSSLRRVDVKALDVTMTSRCVEVVSRWCRGCVEAASRLCRGIYIVINVQLYYAMTYSVSAQLYSCNTKCAQFSKAYKLNCIHIFCISSSMVFLLLGSKSNVRLRVFEGTRRTGQMT